MKRLQIMIDEELDEALERLLALGVSPQVDPANIDEVVYGGKSRDRP